MVTRMEGALHPPTCVCVCCEDANAGTAAVERARIRRAIAGALRGLRIQADSMRAAHPSAPGYRMGLTWAGFVDRRIKEIDAATKAPRPARAKGKR